MSRSCILLGSLGLIEYKQCVVIIYIDGIMRIMLFMMLTHYDVFHGVKNKVSIWERLDFCESFQTLREVLSI